MYAELLERIVEMWQVGTYDFANPMLVAVATYLALKHAGLWEER